MSKIFFLFIILFSLSPFIKAQQIQNVRFEQEGKQVNIYYDIVGAKSSNEYEVKVYCSTTGINGFKSDPLAKVSGDIGKGIKGGNGKKVTWNVLNEMEELKSDQVAFKVTARLAKKPSITDIPWVKMVFVEGGTFDMGSNESLDEEPIHKVQINDFYIGKYEITQMQWNEIMGNGNFYNKNCDSCPAEGISWNQAQEFITKLNEKTGQNFRLPTEAEWEYAARGGNQSKGYKYAGSNTIDDVAWISSNSGKNTNSVGKKTPNELGIYDMSGNVWEWCQDQYDDDYYERSPIDNPQGPTSGGYRVTRGGSWNYDEDFSRIADRSRHVPSQKSVVIGFRLAMDY